MNICVFTEYYLYINIFNLLINNSIINHLIKDKDNLYNINY